WPGAPQDRQPEVHERVLAIEGGMREVAGRADPRRLYRGLQLVDGDPAVAVGVSLLRGQDAQQRGREHTVPERRALERHLVAERRGEDDRARAALEPGVDVAVAQ